MTSKRPSLVERAAAQLLKSGNLDSSVTQLLDPDAAAKASAANPAAPPRQAELPQADPALPPPGATVSQTGTEPGIAPRDLPASGGLHALQASLQTARPTPPPAASVGSPDRRIETAALERAGMIDWEQARSRISEEFRIVQRQILRNVTSPEIIAHGNANLIMLTSSRPGEGKSFVALNLAAGIARQADHDVLLVDIDYKQDSIGTALGLAGAPGLLDLVTDPTLDPNQVIMKTDIKNLSVLSIGRHGERSPELFASRQATRLIPSLARRYADRLVILDAPPCLATSEPGVLASIVGQIVLVVEAEMTQREEVEAAMDLVHACPAITLLLNKAQFLTRYTFGAYSSSYSLPYTS